MIHNCVLNVFAVVCFIRCVILEAKKAEDEQLLSVHTKKHVDLINKISSKLYDSRRLKIAHKLDSVYFNEGSSEAAYLAAGSAIEVIFQDFFAYPFVSFYVIIVLSHITC